MYQDQLREAVVQTAIPVVKGYKLLIAMPLMQKKTSGGIHLPDEHVGREETATIVGNVVSMGPDAYKDETRFPSGAYCGVGDWVIFRSYAGTRFKMKDQEFRLINDDTVEAVVTDPRSVSRA